MVNKDRRICPSLHYLSLNHCMVLLMVSCVRQQAGLLGGKQGSRQGPSQNKGLSLWMKLLGKTPYPCVFGCSQLGQIMKIELVPCSCSPMLLLATCSLHLEYHLHKLCGTEETLQLGCLKDNSGRGLPVATATTSSMGTSAHNQRLFCKWSGEGSARDPACWGGKVGHHQDLMVWNLLSQCS